MHIRPTPQSPRWVTLRLWVGSLTYRLHLRRRMRASPPRPHGPHRSAPWRTRVLLLACVASSALLLTAPWRNPAPTSGPPVALAPPTLSPAPTTAVAGAHMVQPGGDAAPVAVEVSQLGRPCGPASEEARARVSPELLRQLWPAGGVDRDAACTWHAGGAGVPPQCCCAYAGDRDSKGSKGAWGAGGGGKRGLRGQGGGLCDRCRGAAATVLVNATDFSHHCTPSLKHSTTCRPVRMGHIAVCTARVRVQSVLMPRPTPDLSSF